MTRFDHPDLGFDPRIADWFEADPDQAPDQVLETVLAALPSVQQRRAWRVPWRFPRMTMPFRVAAIVVLGALLIAGLGAVGGFGIGPGVAPAPTQAPCPSPFGDLQPPSAAPSSGLPTCGAFESTHYRYLIRYPAGWKAAPASRPWSMQVDQGDWLTPAADRFIDESAIRNQQVGVTGLSSSLPAGMSEIDWINAYRAPVATGTPCTQVALTDAEGIVIDGHPARLVKDPPEACGDSEAFVLVDGRMFVFSEWRGGRDVLLKAFLSTVRFLPVAR